jgi:putative hemolysin
VPKSFAQQHADRLAPIVVYPLWVASLVFSPIVWVMVAFSARVSRRLGLETAPRKLVQREDLELIVRGAARGDISDGERRMISRIFDFGERTAYDMMVGLSSLTALREDMTVEEAVRAVAESGYTRYPVYRERVDRVVGIVHTFELLKAGRDARAVGQLMRPPIFAPENQPAVELLMTLQRQRQGMAIVVDEYGGAVGVVTIEDILEEIVGEIDDEYDVAPAGLRREGEGVWRARAQVRIAEVNRVLKIDLPEGEDYESLAGLILDQLKHIPKSGESVVVGGVTLVVTAASQRAIEEVQIRLTRKR